MLRALALAFLLPAFAAAEGRTLLPAPEQARWNGVGRLNLGDGFCTGALVAPDLVATAAHCLVSPKTGKDRLAERVTFVAGYRLRKHVGFAKAKGLARHPDYRWSRAPSGDDVATDLALVRLAAPIEGAAPFGLAPGPATGQRVTILSYGRDRPEIPSIQPSCLVTARAGAVAVLDCDVTWGVSGAPVFLETADGPKIVAVVSAMGDWRGAKRAFAVSLEAALGPVLAQP